MRKCIHATFTIQSASIQIFAHFDTLHYTAQFNIPEKVMMPRASTFRNVFHKSKRCGHGLPNKKICVRLKKMPT